MLAKKVVKKSSITFSTYFFSTIFSQKSITEKEVTDIFLKKIFKIVLTLYTVSGNRVIFLVYCTELNSCQYFHKAEWLNYTEMIKNSYH